MSNHAILNEAYERFRDTGPEWGEDSLTNHGPMAVEVLVRRGRVDDVHPWVDAYLPRLDELPAASDPITAANWSEALGDGNRIGDWTRYFDGLLAEQPWRDVLVTWWPRLLPGIAAGATHGLIRTAHAVRTLLAGDDEPPAVRELGRGLAFWAARSRAVPGVSTPAGDLDAGAAIAALPRIGEQRGPVAGRLGQLAEMEQWPGALAALRAAKSPDEIRDRLADLVSAASAGYLVHAPASPVLLVHTVTAPNAVLHTLPALPVELWQPSLAAVWAVSAALTSAYAPAGGAEPTGLPVTPDAADPATEALDRAVAHGDEHVIKLTDAVADSFARSGDSAVLAAGLRAGDVIRSPRA